VISEWELDPGVLAGAGVALALFAKGFVRLRRRGRATWDRAVLFGLGVAVATLALVSPLHEISESLLAGHMLQHVLIGDVAPALVVVALRGPLTFFFLPASLLRPLARRRGLRSLLAWLLRPGVSFSVWALSLGLWHVPAAYDYALTHQVVHDLQHVSFMVGGVLIWAQLVDPARRRALSRNGRLVYAVCIFAAGQVLADVLLFAAPLFPSYASRSDQQLAGLVMLVEQALALGACVVFLLRPSFARPRVRAKAPLLGLFGASPRTPRPSDLRFRPERGT
jgi:cytochrome c oxidase assembly factor CtaG